MAKVRGSVKICFYKSVYTQIQVESYDIATGISTCWGAAAVTKVLLGGRGFSAKFLRLAMHDKVLQVPLQCTRKLHLQRSTHKLPKKEETL
jgi:hypothetical protein